MKKSTRIKTLAATALVACFGFAGLFAAPTYAIDCDSSNGWVEEHGTCVKQDPNTPSLWKMVNTIINTILAVVGVIAVFMVILGGIQYATSAGDSGKVKKAKDTILYGIVGLVIALLAFAIVNFVLNNIFDDTNTVDYSRISNPTECANQGGKWDTTNNKCNAS